MVSLIESVRKYESIAGAKWLPIALLPATVIAWSGGLPAWLLMWALAASIFAGLKWLTFAGQNRGTARLGRSLGYLLAWPGLDARQFLSDRPAKPPARREWIFATAKLMLGLALLGIAAALVGEQEPLLVGWIGMIGLAFTLHFGLFHVLSLGWRRSGVDAPPIMDWPVLASSTAEFWGRRWNRAFRDVASRYIFRPLVGRVGSAGATLAVFLVSGILHDLVISVPAQAGYGRPTTYFVLQAVAVLMEHSRFGRGIGLGRGLVGRAFCLTAVVAPLPLLLHGPFVQRVVIPMLEAIALN